MKKITKATSEKIKNRAKRRLRSRKGVQGTAERPRLCVTKTNMSMVAQLIDDVKGVTLTSLTTPRGKTANRDLSKALGKDIALKADALGVKACVFDRSGNLYHGRIASVAEGAREAGLKF